MSANRLANETSPYLLQHKDNPVHWYPWGDEAFTAARESNRPIMLSIGYAACHWCHVMAHESFEDPNTAKVMNALYVNIKVDREEHPDVDKIYMDAIHSLGEQGGWPLTMFLDHDGRPFWGGTYFPKQAAYGRPGFTQVLQQISMVWHREPEKISQSASAISAALKDSAASDGKASLSPDVLDKAAQGLLQAMDLQNGGLRGAPKFPQGSIFNFLWQLSRRTGNTAGQDAVVTTMTHICQGGIYDHLAGGLSRYSIDHRWLAPHFEKMLYDNAQLIGLLGDIWNVTGNDLFRQRIEETVSWLQRDMLIDSGAFAASYDADSEGEEGRYYVWSKSEVTDVLNEDAELFCRFYDVTETGNWEGKTILNRLNALDPGSAKDEFALGNARAKLLARRETRIPPEWDDKALGDWNGLMIEALANTGAIMQRPDWIDCASRAMAAIIDHLWDGTTLWHAWRAGETRNLATLDDHANLIAAAIALQQATGNRKHLEIAIDLTDKLIREFWDNEAGGFFFTSSAASNLIVRSRFAHDDATPNGNATMLANLTRLGLILPDPAYTERAHALHDAFAANVMRAPAAHSGFLTAFDTLLNHTLAVIIANPDDPKSGALRDSVRRQAKSEVVFFEVEPGHTFPQGHPAHGRSAIDGKATLYLCQGQTCSLPVTDETDLETLFAAE